jgi:hypothetical protein
MRPGVVKQGAGVRTGSRFTTGVDLQVSISPGPKYYQVYRVIY